MGQSCEEHKHYRKQKTTGLQNISLCSEIVRHLDTKCPIVYAGVWVCACACVGVCVHVRASTPPQSTCTYLVLQKKMAHKVKQIKGQGDLKDKKPDPSVEKR